MTDQPHYQLPPAQRRRLVFRAVLRGVLTAAALVVLYYVLPLDQPWNGDTAVRILIGLLVFAGIAVWQVRSIIGSRYPRIRAFEALGLILPFYLLVFASTYFVMQRASAANFTQPLTRTDALYFAVTVFSTVGFGDITPKSEAARVLLIVQMLGDIALLGAGVRVLLGAVRRGPTTGHERPGRPGGREDRQDRAAGLWTCAPRGAPHGQRRRQFSASADLRGGAATPRYRHGCLGGVSDSSALAEARRIVPAPPIRARRHGGTPSISVSSEKLRNVLISTISPSWRTLLRVGATAIVRIRSAATSISSPSSRVPPNAWRRTR